MLALGACTICTHAGCMACVNAVCWSVSRSWALLLLPESCAGWVWLSVCVAGALCADQGTCALLHSFGCVCVGAPRRACVLFPPAPAAGRVLFLAPAVWDLAGALLLCILGAHAHMAVMCVWHVCPVVGVHMFVHLALARSAGVVFWLWADRQGAGVTVSSLKLAV